MALIANMRRCGNTTRQIDEAIQMLLGKGMCYIVDHAHKEHDNGGALNRAQRTMLDKLFRRLDMEHNLKNRRDYTYNEKSKIIELKQQPWVKNSI